MTADPTAGTPALARLRQVLGGQITTAEAVALVILLAGAAGMTVVVWWTSRPVTVGPPVDVAGPVLVTDDHTPGATLLVHVAGAVHDAGVVRLPEGARIGDAIAAAGGATPDASLAAVNLARPLRDGEQVVVPSRQDEPVGDGAATTAPLAPVRLPDGRLDLNAVTQEDLETLPGVGPVTAERILAHREALGGFDDASQLLEVRGIGPTTFAAIEPLVGV